MRWVAVIASSKLGFCGPYGTAAAPPPLPSLQGAFTEERSVLDDEADQAAARQWQARRPAVEPAGDRALGAQAGDTAAARPQQQQQQPREPEPVVSMFGRQVGELWCTWRLASRSAA